jgi:hypothetical protein
MDNEDCDSLFESLLEGGTPRGKKRPLDLGTLLEHDPSSPSQPKELTWRRDPEESFSDWTIMSHVKQRSSQHQQLIMSTRLF